MKRFAQLSSLLIFIVFIGCSGITQYNDSEVAAIVKGVEITVGDLRFLYPDDIALDYLNGAIQVELVKQEVINMDLDISDKLSENDWFAELPPKDTKDEGGKQIRKFAKYQAKKLNMTPEEFQKQYAEKIVEQNAYLVTYLEEKLGKIDDVNDKNIDEFNDEAYNLLEKLVKENEDEIEVFIE